MPDRGPADTVTIDKEMAITHRDFFRILPGVFEGEPFRTDGNRIVFEKGGRRLEIELSPEGQRRIALLTLPVTHVCLAFFGYGDAEMKSFLSRFDRSFQRGGG
ncbi:MAG: hypothetical protein KIT00_12220 [Rhodospirillales bacterium]|nr:hypothetical protein [Rhodospirillales bacterium]